MSFFLPHLRLGRSGFTLIEMVVVIAIIMTLLGLIFFPYGYYMQRAYVERTTDTIGQGWVLAHKDIRNGRLYDIDKTANKVLILRKGSTRIDTYLLSGSRLPDFSTLDTNPDIKADTLIDFDSKVEILSFSGVGIDPTDDIIGYYIEAPYASGAFFTGALLPFSSTGIVLTIGYPGADISSGRARNVLLRPYLQ